MFCSANVFTSLFTGSVRNWRRRWKHFNNFSHITKETSGMNRKILKCNFFWYFTGVVFALFLYFMYCFAIHQCNLNTTQKKGVRWIYSLTAKRSTVWYLLVTDRLSVWSWWTLVSTNTTRLFNFSKLTEYECEWLFISKLYVWWTDARATDGCWDWLQLPSDSKGIKM